LGKEGAVQDQIDATVKDAIKRAKSQLPSGRHSNRAPNAARRFRGAPRGHSGVRLCLSCQDAKDREEKHNAGYNRRGSKDSQLR
jgi:hypothetical protein